MDSGPLKCERAINSYYSFSECHLFCRSPAIYQWKVRSLSSLHFIIFSLLLASCRTYSPRNLWTTAFSSSPFGLSSTIYSFETKERGQKNIEEGYDKRNCILVSANVYDEYSYTIEGKLYAINFLYFRIAIYDVMEYVDSKEGPLS